MKCPDCDKDRGTGQTTKQMERAAKGAVFIWCNQYLEYPKRLARDIGRHDLRIFGPEVFSSHGREKLRGITFPEVIVDHAYRPQGDHQWKQYYVSMEIFRAHARP